MKRLVIVLAILVVGLLGYIIYTAFLPPANPSEDTPATARPDTGKTLDLSGKNLDKVSADQLDNTSITTLDVSGNKLTGALPAEIRKLSNLEVLIASNNRLTGIPAEIGQLSKLRVANFANNDLSGLPLEIGNLSKLETLDLRGNPKLSTYDLGLIRQKIPTATILTD